MARYLLCVTTTEPVNLETNSTLIPLLCSDTSEDMRVIHNSYFSNIFNGIGEAIGLIGFGSCEEVDKLEELALGIIVNPNHSLFEKDQVYKNKYVLTSALKRHSILKHFQFKTTRSSSISYSIQCLGENCCLSLRASSLNKSQMFKIREFESEHTCLLLHNSLSERQATKSVVGSIIVGKCAEPDVIYTPKDIQRDMLSEYGVRLTYMQAWRAKEAALELVRGDPIQSYAKLPSYFHILEATYPGSILPLAYAIVDSENDASWRWFFEQFRDAFGQRLEMCIVSDRHASIIKATSRVYDEVPHFVCMWHLLQNIMKNFRKSQQRVTELFYSMAKTYTMTEFNQCMTIVEKIDKRIKDYLLNIGYNKWSRVHAEVNRTWMMTSNIAESVNSRTRHAKVLTVLHLLEFMRQLVQKWNNNNRSKATFSGFHLGKKYENILRRNKTASEKLRVVETNKYVYTVLDGITQFTVCLHQRTCTCGRFQLDELPCPHALAVLTIKHTGYEKYCSDYYTRKNLLLTYQFQMDPLPDESTWNTPTHVLEEVVLPPHGKRPPGRPKNKRHTQLREDGFKKAKITCSNCGQQDHNRKTCKNVRPYDQE
ncbi:uncharacterized protein [Solanum tuberosum]|uniref:uncharacterized protein n=1 Tax=Solanum tuberosum TaxID=4113 RepID=UPI00073A48B0|nr:PREDICTED: uncharacterized protein LOC107062147 [Solanum tuberosum]